MEKDTGSDKSSNNSPSGKIRPSFYVIAVILLLPMTISKLSYYSKLAKST
jgi:hypothetical protein